MAMAFGAPSLDAVAEKLADVLEMQPPEGLREKIQGLRKLKSIADSRPKIVSKGVCQEIVLRGTKWTSRGSRSRRAGPAILRRSSPSPR